MIELRHVSKRYGATTAVRDLSFSVAPGKITGLLGPNGSGKSTTLRMILGLDLPSSGSVTVLGKPYRDLAAPMQHVGALLETGVTHGGRSARQHLLWVAQAGGLPEIRIDEVLTTVGLEKVSLNRAETYSLGMLQRLGIASAMLGDPEVLLFDEPVNGLDPEGIRWFRQLMKSLAARGKTILISSHLMSEMELIADQLIVLGRGQLVADMPTDAFIRMHTGASVRVASPAADYLAALLERAGATVVRENERVLTVTAMDAAQIGDVALTNGIALHELSPRRADLESAYLALTHDKGDYAVQEGIATHV